MKDQLIPETFRWGRDLAISNGLRGKAIRERVPLGGAVSCWFDSTRFTRLVAERIPTYGRLGVADAPSA
jgi:hypothetical protein